MAVENGENQVHPITPEEVAGKKENLFPPEVIESFNTLIAQGYSNGISCVLQDEVVALMVEKGLNRQEIFRKGWLEIEEIYRASRWDVKYEKPGYNEDGHSSFTFTPRRKYS